MEFARLLKSIRTLVPALILGAALLAPAAAEARSITVGAETVVRPLEDIRLQGPGGEALYLGYKLTFNWLGLPYSVSDDGYVLGVKGKPLYYAVDRDQLSQWQAQGVVPAPLPIYQLSTADLVLGHLLWIVLALTGGWLALRSLLARAASRAKAETGAAPAPSQDAIRRLAQVARSELTVAADRVATVAAAAPAATPVATSSPSVPAAPATAAPRIEPTRLHTIATPRREPPQAQVSRLPVAKTRCRVKALKSA